MSFYRLVDFMIRPNRNFPKLTIYEDEVVDTAKAVEARLTYLTEDDILDNLEELADCEPSDLRSHAINVNLRLLHNRGRLFTEDTIEFLMDSKLMDTGAFDEVLSYLAFMLVLKDSHRTGKSPNPLHFKAATFNKLSSICERANRTGNTRALACLHKYGFM